ncbi:hypothetical protein L208DRAFT_1264885, partial [Tricholoma matsutake]
GASIMMEIFGPHLNTLQTKILSSQYHKDIGGKCPCGTNSAPYQCEECFQPRMLCQSCITSTHTQLLYHHIGEWSGAHFQCTSLFSLSAALCLGHNGEKCWNHVPGPRHNSVVIHTNSVHHVRIDMGNPWVKPVQFPTNAVQLTQCQLFPATMERPETVFTFAILNDFHVHSLSLKKSAMDYIDALREQTNPAFPQKTPIKFHYIEHIWSHLATQRRTGQAHGIDEILTHHRPGSLTLRCPSCPEVDFNIDQKIMDEAQENEMHKYTLYLSMDSNFCLQWKHKNGDPDDMALNQGNGYFIESAAYKNYIAQVQPDTEVHQSIGHDLGNPWKSTCAHLCAIRLQNIIKFNNTDISGVVVVQCACHGFYFPQGAVDLKKGEA